MSTTTQGETYEGQSTSQRVITAVADETGKDVTEVGPLYHVIDPDALDRLFSATRGSGRNQGYVEFTFAGCDVTVRGNGEVEVTQREMTVGAPDDSDSESRRVGTDRMP